MSAKEFPFGESLYSPIIVINELTIESKVKSDLYKNVLGGETTQINIKNRPSRMMLRKPVIVTTNTHIWKYVTNDREMFKNRCFMFSNLIPSTVAREFSKKGTPNPRYLQDVFRLMLNGEYDSFMQVEESNPTQQISTESQHSDQSTQTETDTSNMETQTQTETVDVTSQTTTCYGCQVGHPSQVQHMQPGGCMHA